MSCVCIYWNTKQTFSVSQIFCFMFIFMQNRWFDRQNDSLSAFSPPDTCQALPLYESKVKMWQNQKRTDKRQTIKIYIFLNVENNKSEDMKTWEIWVAYGTHLHLVLLKFLPHHIAGSPNSHNIHRNNREKKKRGKKKKKRYTVSKAQRITAISTTEKITYNSLHYNKKHKKFS